ncbi:KPN_02809 family neutral zinc metallopeptidase [Goodfellowiella coeruleoviolacea]|uniref:Neutral zinc metallopeptidase n=1 Tax=Goodfellowiella coeruleoviolacea TaxID=334858 RepID=A0AAE3GAV0_9PSEU|nr:neutral zinc metallopeptidase [Goodfellowiella coeruleoviolacea]MCP2164418.1 hypothetical protein [Goodfellowiella coeruleoviolacea]
MEFDENASIDTSQVEDLRGSGGGGGIGGRVLLGGGGLGVVGVLIYFLLSQLGGTAVLPSGSGFDDVGSGQQLGSDSLQQKCRTGADANANQDCRAVAYINSIQNYWTDAFARSGRTYQVTRTDFFSGGVQTRCGNATSAAGPFYCPADRKVYIDLSFFTELRTRFGAQGGQFVEAYVLAHEYGHHVQNLLGTSDRVRTRSGANSDSVRLELQADCYAGVWAAHATSTPTSSGQPLITKITQDDINRALDAAARIGDDYIQSEIGGGRIDTTQFTHGSSAQRQKWFTTGIQSGDPARCDTFGARDLG